MGLLEDIAGFVQGAATGYPDPADVATPPQRVPQSTPILGLTTGGPTQPTPILGLTTGGLRLDRYLGLDSGPVRRDRWLDSTRRLGPSHRVWRGWVAGRPPPRRNWMPW